MTASQTRPESSPALPSASASAEAPAPVSIRTIAKWRREGVKFACLTCYDATTARWLERAGVPMLLVGDTAAEVILGHHATIHAPLDFMVTITAAVKRGAPIRFVLADMPFLSYGADEAEGVRNAGRFMTEGHADAVKLVVVQANIVANETEDKVVRSFVRRRRWTCGRATSNAATGDRRRCGGRPLFF